MKGVPGGDNLVKDAQCYELFGGIALKNHAFSFISLCMLRMKRLPPVPSLVVFHSFVSYLVHIYIFFG